MYMLLTKVQLLTVAPIHVQHGANDLCHCLPPLMWPSPREPVLCTPHQPMVPRIFRSHWSTSYQW